MKKILTSMVVTGLIALVGLSADDQKLTLEVGTKGPDRYADGSSVLVRETYLLVYIKAGAEFAGVQTDGSLVDTLNNEVVTSIPAVEGNHGVRCAYRALEYTDSMYPATGSWALVLLDTRRNDGTLGGLVAASDAGTAAASPTPMSGPQSLRQKTTGGVVANRMTKSRADAKAARIKAIRKDGAKLSLKVEDLSANALYDVHGADHLGGTWEKVAERVQVGDDTVTLDVQPRVRFFKVVTQ